MKLFIIALLAVAAFAQNDTHGCLPNQYWNGQGACVNMQGWCKPVNSIMYDTCDSCVPCPATGTCPGNQPCYFNTYCQNLGSYCGGPRINCTSTQRYSVSQKKCVDLPTGFCQPASGSWLLDSCDQCTPCVGVGESCPGYVAGGKALCQTQMNCGDYNTFCQGNNSQPQPPTPTPSTNTTNNTCLPNQYWDTTNSSCVNEQGWCKPSATSWMYDTCDSCVPCPSSGPCPGNQQCVKQAYCSNLGSYCGGPYVICQKGQTYSVTQQKCIDLPQGFCKPANSWSVDSCSNCQVCYGNGEDCPGYQNNGQSFCVTKINCGGWVDWCSTTSSQ